MSQSHLNFSWGHLVMLACTAGLHIRFPEPIHSRHVHRKTFHSYCGVCVWPKRAPAHWGRTAWFPLSRLHVHALWIRHSSCACPSQRGLVGTKVWGIARHLCTLLYSPGMQGPSPLTFTTKHCRCPGLSTISFVNFNFVELCRNTGIRIGSTILCSACRQAGENFTCVFCPTLKIKPCTAQLVEPLALPEGMQHLIFH